jgi:hypothetical protein
MKNSSKGIEIDLKTGLDSIVLYYTLKRGLIINYLKNRIINAYGKPDIESEEFAKTFIFFKDIP